MLVAAGVLAPLDLLGISLSLLVQPPPTTMKGCLPVHVILMLATSYNLLFNFTCSPPPHPVDPPPSPSSTSISNRPIPKHGYLFYLPLFLGSVILLPLIPTYHPHDNLSTSVLYFLATFIPMVSQLQEGEPL